ncbi:MAG TPA: sulfite exporter TauE/SafE family protein [Marmoricola sp.]|nr:sulfite exporter TauE/SafE family protein [Marmoricola sp.]
MALLATTLVVGATVQGLVGLGVGMVSAPVVTLLEPSLMPGMLLFMGLATPLVTLVHEHHDIDWRGLAWALPMRIPGTLLGLLLVATVSERSLGLTVAVVVLLSVLVTVRAVRLPVNRVTLSTAGVVSGVTATTTSIGGPPIAVLYQHERPSRIRSTLAIYFSAGAVFSLVGLGVTGQLTLAELGIALLMLPALVVGVFLARVLRGRLPSESIRGGVLLVCAASAALLLVRSLA